MDALLAAAIAAAAVLVSQLIAALAPRWNLKSDVTREDSIESSRRRLEVYEGFVEAIFGQLDSSKDGAGHLNPRAEKELLRVFRTFRTRVLLVGSDEVVRSFNDWNLYSERNSTVEDAQDMLAAMADLVVAIRKGPRISAIRPQENRDPSGLPYGRRGARGRHGETPRATIREHPLSLTQQFQGSWSGEGGSGGTSRGGRRPLTPASTPSPAVVKLCPEAWAIHTPCPGAPARPRTRARRG